MAWNVMLLHYHKSLDSGEMKLEPKSKCKPLTYYITYHGAHLFLFMTANKKKVTIYIDACYHNLWIIKIHALHHIVKAIATSNNITCIL
jgi:hypothetical protein